MMGKFVKIILVALFLGKLGIIYAKPEKSPEYLKYVNEITRSFNAAMKKEFGLICIGSGGSMPYDVEALDIHFIAYGYSSIDRARELEVKATERLTEMVNSHKDIQPFLRESPFPSTRAKVAIDFRKKDNTFQDSGVVFVFPAKGILVYRTYDAPNDKLIPLYEEPYEEALKKVQAGK